MRAFLVFTENYLRPNGCCGTDFTAAVKCKNSKTEKQSEIIEIYIIKYKSNF